MSTATTTMRVLWRRRRFRCSFIRAPRDLRPDAPTATGAVRSRPQSSATANLTVSALVEPTLQDRHSRGLIDHRALGLRPDAGITQPPLRAHRGQPLVGKPHRNFRNALGQLL